MAGSTQASACAVSDIILRPCPFCGAIPEQPGCFELLDGDSGKWGAVRCSCGACSGDVRTGYYDVSVWAEAAAKEWNTRDGISP